MATAIRPKESKGALEPVPNTYAVENGVLYDYYPIKLGDRKGDLVQIVKLPPVLKAGYVTYQKQLFKVELRDFLRGRVNVGATSKFTPSVEPTSNVGDPDLNTAPSVDEPSAASNQQGAGDTSGVQIDPAINMAWEEQIRTLLALDDPETQWDYEAVTQP